MQDFMASSPPAWNANMRPGVIHEGEDDWEDDVDGIQDIPNAHFDVLDSSLPGYDSGESSPGTNAYLASDYGEPTQWDAERAARALLSTVEKEKPLSKPKWHFGIRSRSPPMEVMLEIYKTLVTLGMQWKRKEGIGMPEIGPPLADGYPEEVNAALSQWAAHHGEVQMGKKQPPKKETSVQDKAAQNLYLVETRARYGEIIVSNVPNTRAHDRFEWIFSFTASTETTTWSISVT